MARLTLMRMSRNCKSEKCGKLKCEEVRREISASVGTQACWQVTCKGKIKGCTGNGLDPKIHIRVS